MRHVADTWTLEGITTLMKDCIDTNDKFSKRLRTLNSGSKKMTKPLLGKSLANHCSTYGTEILPQRLQELFSDLEDVK